MPRRYPVAFRRKVLDLIEAGRLVAENAVQLGTTEQTVYNWRNQDRIDRGLRVWVSTSESAPASASAARCRGSTCGGIASPRRVRCATPWVICQVHDTRRVRPTAPAGCTLNSSWGAT